MYGEGGFRKTAVHGIAMLVVRLEISLLSQNLIPVDRPYTVSVRLPEVEFATKQAKA